MRHRFHLLDLLVPVLVTIGALAIADALHRCGAIVSVTEPLTAAIIGAVICWLIVVATVDRGRGRSG